MQIIVLIYIHFLEYGVTNNDFQPYMLITISWKHMCYNILWDILIYILCKPFQQRRFNYIELIRSLLYWLLALPILSSFWNILQNNYLHTPNNRVPNKLTFTLSTTHVTCVPTTRFVHMRKEAVESRSEVREISCKPMVMSVVYDSVSHAPFHICFFQFSKYIFRPPHFDRDW